MGNVDCHGRDVLIHFNANKIYPGEKSSIRNNKEALNVAFNLHLGLRSVNCRGKRYSGGGVRGSNHTKSENHVIFVEVPTIRLTEPKIEFCIRPTLA